MPSARKRSRSKSQERDRRNKEKKRAYDPKDPKSVAVKYGLEDQSTVKKTEEKQEEKKDDSFLEFKKALEMAAKQEGKPVLPEITTKGTGIVPVSSGTLKKVAQQKKAADEAKLKPKYLSKKDREQAALQRLKEQREREAKENEPEDEESLRNRRELERKRRREQREKEEEEARKRREERQKSKEGRQKEKELAVIRETYLGKKKKKRTVVPPSQKFKFSFDWEATDDTSQELNALYDQRHNTALLFGRGFMGGIDRREQRKKQGFYEELMSSRNSDFKELRNQDKVKIREEREKKKAIDAAKQNRHWSEKTLTEMEERDWRIFKEDFNIGCRGANIPNPLRYWAEAALPEEIYKALSKAGYKAPTPIQRAAIPVGLKNIDVVGIAETGSGKTCAYLIPLLVYLANLPRLTQETAQDGPYAIIMAPTRELAHQISDECDKFAGAMGIRSVSIVGGLSIQDQGFLVRKGAEVVIATPGRLYDCIERRYLVLNQCTYCVLDEADRMIDMNFEPQIMRILDTMPATNLKPENIEQVDEKKRYRQTIMFSATMPLKVELLARKYLRHPIFISIGDRKGDAAKMVEQRVLWMAEGAKKKKLIDILSQEAPPFIVFMNAKKSCDRLSGELNKNGLRSVVIHGGKIQEQREENLRAFKENEYDILIATDVVGRGIDITGVEQVINYDMPKDIEKYTHRIGRTGRAGRKGIATSFLTPQDTDVMFDLKEMLRKAGAPIPQELQRSEAAKQKPGTVSLKRRHQGIIYAK